MYILMNRRYQQYTCMYVNKQMSSARKSWLPEEDKVLLSLVSKHGMKKWNYIAKELKVKRQSRRTGKQCRERYMNHLSPEVQKKKWSQKEEETMLSQHEIHGNKWTVIAELLPGRTDNSIKNYFYSMVRRSLRRMGKVVGEKDSTSKMKMIKPATLSMLFEANYDCEAPNPTEHNREDRGEDRGEDRREDMKEGMKEDMPLKQRKQNLVQLLRSHRHFLCKEIMSFSHFKPSRNESVLEQKADIFNQVLQKIYAINQEYLAIRDQEIKSKAEENKFQAEYKRCMESDSNLDQEEPSENNHQISKQSVFDSKKQTDFKKENIKKQLTLESNAKNNVVISMVLDKHCIQMNKNQLNQIKVNPSFLELMQRSSNSVDQQLYNQNQEINEDQDPDFLLQNLQKNDCQEYAKESGSARRKESPQNRENFSLNITPQGYINNPTPFINISLSELLHQATLDEECSLIIKKIQSNLQSRQLKITSNSAFKTCL